MSEKILARASGRQEVTAGDIVWVHVDKAMMDDILGPRVEIADRMPEIKDRLLEPDNVVIIADHYTPPASINQAQIVKFTRDWAKKYGVKNYYEYEGPCHQIMAEKGHVLPGSIVLGTDSHTCMGGALGAFASGVGSTEMMGILLTGKTWLRVPETIRVRWRGLPPRGVMAKDISLATIGTIGHAGATYKAVEYVGETITELSLDERLAITNMAVEMGAKVGLMVADAKVAEYLKERGLKEEGPFYSPPAEPCEHYSGGDASPLRDHDGWAVTESDEDAVFCQSYEFEADTLVPQVSCPHEVDNVVAAREVAGTVIDQAYIGSCTGGRLHDLAAAAAILKGRKVRRGVRLLVSPASQDIWRQANEAGILQTLAQAGAMILAPTCGVCVGLHSGLLADGETCISASNRNFIGRMGSKKANIYLGSPMTAAASAIAGTISDPREFL